MKRVSILGSTGSIGRSTLAVVDAFREELKVVGLAAGSNIGLLAEQIAKYRPEIVSVREILPVDSEHNAVHQALRCGGHQEVQRIILTASGGPFLGRDLTTFDDVTIEAALAHPTWRMGNKISIDSATMMNKGLEVIEAHHLF